MIAALLLTLPLLATTAPSPIPDDGNVYSEDLRAGDNEDMRYFLIGTKKKKAPKDGFKLAIIMPGGPGGDTFHSFVKDIYRLSLDQQWIAVQPVSKKWTPGQTTIWPTSKSRVTKMKFTTEEFVDGILKDLKARKIRINKRQVFSLSWSSSGPAAYCIAMQDKSPVTGSLVAMSVFRENWMPHPKKAKGQPFYIYHSPTDDVTTFDHAEKARDTLKKNGAKVEFVTFEGGHAMNHPKIFPDLKKGFEWLEKNAGRPRR